MHEFVLVSVYVDGIHNHDRLFVCLLVDVPCRAHRPEQREWGTGCQVHLAVDLDTHTDTLVYWSFPGWPAIRWRMLAAVALTLSQTFVGDSHFPGAAAAAAAPLSPSACFNKGYPRSESGRQEPAAIFLVPQWLSPHFSTFSKFHTDFFKDTDPSRQPSFLPTHSPHSPAIPSRSR